MLAKLKKIFQGRSLVKDNEEISPLQSHVNLLCNELVKKAGNFSLDNELASRIKLFRNQSRKKKEADLPSFYLEIEDFLLLQKAYKNINKEAFRTSIISKYPLLRELQGFNLIFLNAGIQKIVISKLYLKDVLLKAKNLLGIFQDPFLIDAENRLENPFEDISLISDYKSASILSDLFKYSQVLQRKLKESLGKNVMLNMYNSVFNKYFESYYLLDSFTITVNLVPEDLLIKENSNLPSKSQLHKLLKSQISSLESINQKLSDEIQDRKIVQKELEVNESLYSAVLHNSLDANVIFDPSGKLLRANEKACKLFEIQEHSHHVIFELLPAEFSENLRNEFETLKIKDIQELSNRSFEFEIKKNESLQYYSLKISPVYIDSSIVYFCVISDITKAKNNLRTIKIAKEIAEKSAKAKTVFLSNMSHEIRTPLNAILGLANLFSEDNFRTESKDFENIEGIKFSAENLLMIVDDVLDFSKIEAGKLKIQKVDFNLKEVIRNIIKGFESKAATKGLEFRVRLDSKIPEYVVGDQYRLSQILNNLLSNAIKFTDYGDVELGVSLIADNEKDSAIKFEVNDTGRGINKENTQQIFESFHQIKADEDRKPEGTGLGLTITTQLIELLGGKLKLESKENKGSTFYFQLTYPKSELDVRKFSKQKTSESEENVLNGKYILVAEDNKLNQLFIKKLFSKWNARTKIVNNGKEALEAVQMEDFDLILMDIHMPVMDGFVATKIIRTLNAPIKNIPIVACSADVFPESRQKAEAAGVNYYITKPVNEIGINEILFLLTN